MIDEKAFLKQIRAAYKKGGYTILESEGTTLISTKAYTVQIFTDKLPRAVLGLIVEHTGGFVVNAAMQLSAGADPQVMLLDAAKQIVMRFAPHEIGGEAKVIPLSWGGYQLYQIDDDDLSVCGVDMETLNIVDVKYSGLCYANIEDGAAQWYGDDIVIYIPIVTRKQNTQYEELEHHLWSFDVAEEEK